MMYLTEDGSLGLKWIPLAKKDLTGKMDPTGKMDLTDKMDPAVL